VPVVSGADVDPATLKERARLNALAQRAQTGDVAARDELIEAIADDVYRLALRMLWHPQDAEDASQEALVRIVTRLDSFRGEASFRTWSYRVAVNHYLNVRRSRVEREQLSFDVFAAQLLEGLEDHPAERPDARILAEEVKLGCTLAMLLCLDRGQRIAYILGDVFQLPSADAAYVVGVTADAYRKRLSRARSRLREFVEANCGLVNDAAACRCDRRVPAAIRAGRIDPTHLMFARHERVRSGVADMELLHDAASLMRSHPEYHAPASMKERVRDVLAQRRFSILDDPTVQ
jgi:RNA polymerase sigma factor (sigma-70 family)